MERRDGLRSTTYEWEKRERAHARSGFACADPDRAEAEGFVRSVAASAATTVSAAATAATAERVARRAVLGEAVAAIDGAAFGRLEGHLRRFAAITARCVEHLTRARRATVSVHGVSLWVGGDSTKRRLSGGALDRWAHCLASYMNLAPHSWRCARGPPS